MRGACLKKKKRDDDDEEIRDEEEEREKKDEEEEKEKEYKGRTEENRRALAVSAQDDYRNNFRSSFGVRGDVYLWSYCRVRQNSIGMLFVFVHV